MPIHKVEVVNHTKFDDGKIRLWMSSGSYKELDIATSISRLPIDRRTDPDRIAEGGQIDLQDLADHSVPLSSLPDDDPDKTYDPALPNLFWSRSNLVSRSIIVGMKWNGTKYVITVTRNY